MYDEQYYDYEHEESLEIERRNDGDFLSGKV